MKTNIQIMDCTLRDGSYAVNFQFTSRDNFKIGLKKSGNGVMIKISNILPKKHSNFLLQLTHSHNQKA